MAVAAKGDLVSDKESKSNSKVHAECPKCFLPVSHDCHECQHCGHCINPIDSKGWMPLLARNFSLIAVLSLTSFCVLFYFGYSYIL